MFSMCGLLCRFMRGWRHSEAMTLLVKALSQPDTSLVIQRLSTVVEGSKSTSVFCDENVDSYTSQLLWRENGKQASVVYPKQHVSLSHWSQCQNALGGFIPSKNVSGTEVKCTDKSINDTRIVDANIGHSGCVNQNFEGRIMVLLEASVRTPEDQSTISAQRIMVEHLCEPLAWSTYGVLGIIVAASAPQLLAMVRAYFENALVLDENLTIRKMISVETHGEPSSNMTQENWSNKLSAFHWHLSQTSELETLIGRPLSKNGSSRSDATCDGKAVFSVAGETGANGVMPVLAESKEVFKKEVHTNSMSQQLQMYRGGWGGMPDTRQVFTREPLWWRQRVYMPERPLKLRMWMNPVEELWRDLDYCQHLNFNGCGGKSRSEGNINKPNHMERTLQNNGSETNFQMIASDTNCIVTDRRVSKPFQVHSLGRSFDERTQVAVSCQHRVESVAFGDSPYPCFLSNVVCSQSGIKISANDEKVICDATEYYKKAVKAAGTVTGQQDHAVEQRKTSVSSVPEAVDFGENESSEVLLKHNQQMLPFSTDLDVSLTTLMIRDNLANIVENYLMKGTSSNEVTFMHHGNWTTQSLRRPRSSEKLPVIKAASSLPHIFNDSCYQENVLSFDNIAGNDAFVDDSVETMKCLSEPSRDIREKYSEDIEPGALQAEFLKTNDESFSVDTEFVSSDAESLAGDAEFVTGDDESLTCSTEFITGDANYLTVDTEFVTGNSNSLTVYTEFVTGDAASLTTDEFLTCNVDSFAADEEFLACDSQFFSVDADFVLGVAECLTGNGESFTIDAEFVTGDSESLTADIELGSSATEVESTAAVVAINVHCATVSPENIVVKKEFFSPLIETTMEHSKCISQSQLHTESCHPLESELALDYSRQVWELSCATNSGNDVLVVEEMPEVLLNREGKQLEIITTQNLVLSQVSAQKGKLDDFQLEETGKDIQATVLHAETPDAVLTVIDYGIALANSEELNPSVTDIILSTSLVTCSYKSNVSVSESTETAKSQFGDKQVFVELEGAAVMEDASLSAKNPLTTDLEMIVTTSDPNSFLMSEHLYEPEFVHFWQQSDHESVREILLNESEPVKEVTHFNIQSMDNQNDKNKQVEEEAQFSTQNKVIKIAIQNEDLAIDKPNQIDTSTTGPQEKFIVSCPSDLFVNNPNSKETQLSPPVFSPSQNVLTANYLSRYRHQEVRSSSDIPSRHSSRSGVSDLEDDVFLPIAAEEVKLSEVKITMLVEPLYLPEAEVKMFEDDDLQKCHTEQLCDEEIKSDAELPKSRNLRSCGVTSNLQIPLGCETNAVTMVLPVTRIRKSVSDDAFVFTPFTNSSEITPSINDTANLKERQNNFAIKVENLFEFSAPGFVPISQVMDEGSALKQILPELDKELEKEKTNVGSIDNFVRPQGDTNTCSLKVSEDNAKPSIDLPREQLDQVVSSVPDCDNIIDQSVDEHDVLQLSNSSVEMYANKSKRDLNVWERDSVKSEQCSMNNKRDSMISASSTTSSIADGASESEISTGLTEWCGGRHTRSVSSSQEVNVSSIESYSNDARARVYTLSSLSSIKSEQAMPTASGTAEAAALLLKSEGSLDRFPYFERVSAQLREKRRAKRQRPSQRSLDDNLGLEKKKQNRVMLPFKPFGPRGKKMEEKSTEKKRDNDEEIIQNKTCTNSKLKDEGLVEKKSSSFSLKGFLHRKRKVKSMEKVTSIEVNDKSSPSIFRKFDLRSRQQSSSKTIVGKSSDKMEELPAIEVTRIQHPVEPSDISYMPSFKASSIMTATASTISPSEYVSANSDFGTVNSPIRHTSSHGVKTVAQMSPQLYRHVLTRNASNSQESLDAYQASVYATLHGTPHSSPKHKNVPDSVSSYSLPCHDATLPSFPVLGTRALHSSGRCVSITIGFKPQILRQDRTVSVDGDLNTVPISPPTRRRASQSPSGSGLSSSMEILVCGKIRETSRVGESEDPPKSSVSREGSFRLHREISVETLFESPDNTCGQGSPIHHRSYLAKRRRAGFRSSHDSAWSLCSDEMPAIDVSLSGSLPHSHHTSACHKYSLPIGLPLSGISASGGSIPNLSHQGGVSSFLNCGMSHSSSFSTSPFRRPHTSALVMSLPCRGMSSSGGGNSPSGDMTSSMGPLNIVQEEEPRRRNVDTAMEKSPNVLIYTSNQSHHFGVVVRTLQLCLNLDRYVMYHLSDDAAFKSPWLSSTTLLVICGKVSPHICTIFIRYLLQGGRVLAICSDFLNVAIPLHAFELPWTTSVLESGSHLSSEERLVSLNYRHWMDVHLWHPPQCVVSESQPTCFDSQDIVLKRGEAVSENSKITISIEPTHVEIRDEWNDFHRLELSFLASDTTTGAPYLLAAQVHGENGGVAVFSQVHLDRDPQEPISQSQKVMDLRESNESRIGILTDLLASKLGLDTTSETTKLRPTTAHLLGRHEKKQILLENLKPHLSLCRQLKRPLITLQFIPDEEDAHEDAQSDFMPILMRSCPRTFSTVKYYETLSTHDIGRLLLYTDVMTSCMRVSNGYPPLGHGLAVLATQQTHGKGRGGNVWLSPLGCLLFSVELHVPLDSRLGQRISFLQHLVAMASVAAIRQMDGCQELDLRLKWPNDIYFGVETKVGGVLVEATTVSRSVIVNAGCGINLSNSNPTYCINDAIRSYNSKYGTMLPELDREVYLARVFNFLEMYIDAFQSGGHVAVLPDYYKYWLHSNAEVRVQTDSHDRFESATIIGVDSFGYLEARLESTGVSVSLQPDGNSFNMMEGLIYTKISR